MASQDDLFAVYYNTLQQPNYEAASNDYNNQHRQAILADADFLALGELSFLQARSHYLARNNSIAVAAQDKYVNRLGAVKINWKKKDGKKHELMQELWDEFYKNPMLDGYGNGDTMQATWNHARFQAGEAISRMVVDTSADYRVKLKIQDIESHYLDINFQGYGSNVVKSGETVRYGIGFKGSKPTTYYFYKNNTFGLSEADINMLERVPVPASDILHIFERRRSNQWRGIPTIVPMLMELYRIEDLCSATVTRQINAQALSWIIEQTNSYVNTPIGTVNQLGKTNPNDADKKLIFKANSGGVQYLNNGEKFHLVQSADIGANLGTLIKTELERIAAGLGLPYYMLTGDTTGLNFSSIRALLNELRIRLEYIHHFITIPLGIIPLTNRFKAMAELEYSVRNSMPTFQLPRWYGVDDVKDVQADMMEVQCGMATLQSKLDERHTTFEEIMKDREMIQLLGLDILLNQQQSNINSQNATTNGGGSNTNVDGNP